MLPFSLMLISLYHSSTVWLLVQHHKPVWPTYFPPETTLSEKASQSSKVRESEWKLGIPYKPPIPAFNREVQRKQDHRARTVKPKAKIIWRKKKVGFKEEDSPQSQRLIALIPDWLFVNSASLGRVVWTEAGVGTPPPSGYIHCCRFWVHTTWGPRPNSSPCFPMTHLVRVLSHVQAWGAGVGKASIYQPRGQGAGPGVWGGRWGASKRAPRGWNLKATSQGFPPISSTSFRIRDTLRLQP